MSWYTISFNQHDGSGTSPSTVYYNTVGPMFATQQSTQEQYRIHTFNGFFQLLSSVPTKTNYDFAGYYTAATGGDLYIDLDGYWQNWTIHSNITLHAQWRAYRTITLDSGGDATAATTRLYSKIDGGGLYLDTALEEPATEISVPIGGGVFLGYYYNGEMAVDPQGNITAYGQSLGTPAANMTWTAMWNEFSHVTDYFGLADGTTKFVPFYSDEGANRQRIVTRHYGKFSGSGFSGASATSTVVWRNPTVKYMVVGNKRLQVTLGKAFPKIAPLGRVTHTGYMITSVTIETAAKQFPVITIQGTANEGVDAINTFPVNVPIAANARPQNLLEAFATTAGELQSCTLSASCDPVVLTENMVPCASDVVGGRYELQAEIRQDSGGTEPTMSVRTVGANGVVYGGFEIISSTPRGGGVDYRRRIVTARREM